MIKPLVVIALGVIPGLLGDLGPGGCVCGGGPGPIPVGESTSSTTHAPASSTTSADDTSAGPTLDLAPVADLPVVPDVPGVDECEQVEAPWNGVEPSEVDCTADGLAFCSNDDAEGPAGSRYWECAKGSWVEAPTAGDESCQLDGYDFAYGCFDDGTAIAFVCGVGPGTPCSGPACDACGDDGDAIEFCQDGKLGSDSCLRICTEDGDEQGVTYDYGSCVLDEGAVFCACCDQGDPGCMA